MPVPDSAMLATLAITHPSVRPGIASEVNSASTVTASEILNWTGPQASPPKNSIATSDSAAYSAAIMAMRATRRAPSADLLAEEVVPLLTKDLR